MIRYDRELPIHICAATLCSLKWSRNHIVSCPIVFSLPSPLFPLLSPSNNVQPHMSSEPDFSWYHSSEGDFFGPDPPLVDAPSSAAFDEDVDNDKEVEEFDLELSFKNLDDIFANFHESIPAASAPSAVTYLTESLSELSSQFSCDNTLSCYSIPSEIDSRGSNDDLYSTHTSDYSAPYANGPPSIDAASAINPAALSLDHVVPDADAPMVPEPVKPFRCQLCSFCKVRAHWHL